jgi:hypothetical protein
MFLSLLQKKIIVFSRAKEASVDGVVIFLKGTVRKDNQKME